MPALHIRGQVATINNNNKQFKSRRTRSSVGVQIIMSQVKNISTGEIIDVLNTKNIEGGLIEGRFEFKTRFFNKYGHAVEQVEIRDGHTILKPREGWEIVTGGRKRKATEPATEPTHAQIRPEHAEWRKAVEINGDIDDVIIIHAKGYETFGKDVERVKGVCPWLSWGEEADGTPSAWCGDSCFPQLTSALVENNISFSLVEMGATPEPEPTQVEPEPVFEPTPEPEPEPEPKPMIETDGMTDALALAFAPVFNKVARDLEKKIKGEVREEIDLLKRAAHTHVTKIEVTSPQGTNAVSGIFCDKFDTLLRVVQAGKPVYMYGPAGCGKSYTAKQVADALGLPYFETSQAMFAHDLKGYGDAGGNYVETPLYKAFTQGGLFFLDEVDASRPEAVVVLNNLIANKRFDFPVVGLVEAHPNFRVMAAGNTRMTGHTTQYVARQGQDASFKNRFFFALFTYDERIERALCNDDETIIEYVHDLREAVRTTGIQQLASYRQITDMHELSEILQDDAYLLRGSVFQEKEADEVRMMYEEIAHKNNRWAKATKSLIEILENEKVW